MRIEWVDEAIAIRDAIRGAEMTSDRGPLGMRLQTILEMLETHAAAESAISAVEVPSLLLALYDVAAGIQELEAFDRMRARSGEVVRMKPRLRLVREEEARA